MLQQIWAVARNTFTQTIRQPIFLVVLLSTMGLLTLGPAFSLFTLDDDNALLRDVGLNSMFLAGLILSAFSAVCALTDELERKTVLSVVSKPISRPVFLIGKYFGLVAAVFTGLWIWSCVFLLSLRHGVLMSVRDPFHEPVLSLGFGALLLCVLVATGMNFFKRWVFSSTLSMGLATLLPFATAISYFLGPHWQWQSFAFDSQLAAALLLLAEAIAVFCAIALAASTRLSQALTLATCVIVFFLGLLAEYWLGKESESPILQSMLDTALPSLQFMWLGEALIQGNPVTGYYLLLVSGYCLLYILGILSLATLLFQNRDVG